MWNVMDTKKIFIGANDWSTFLRLNTINFTVLLFESLATLTIVYFSMLLFRTHIIMLLDEYVLYFVLVVLSKLDSSLFSTTKTKYKHYSSC